jgi:formate/nitrite transporter FocA (FNT family)
MKKDRNIILIVLTMSFSIFIAFYDSWDEIEMTAANYAIGLVFLIPFLISIICKKVLFTGGLMTQEDSPVIYKILQLLYGILGTSGILFATAPYFV